jgi:drug/metabolite transporter superfamily protein YnfA
VWLVIDPCVNFGRVYCDFSGIYIFIQFFETPDDG